MTKILFKDLPDRTTPINATNLNKLNNVSIGTSTPTLNEELWVEYNGNLINYGSLNTLNAFINTTTGAISDSQSNQKTIYVAIKPNTKYYVRKTLGARFGIATYTSVPTYGSTCTSFVSNNTAQTLNITSGANDKYLAVWLYNSNADTSSFDSIVQSTIITTYETTESNVIKTEINANNNGTYEKLTDTVNIGIDSNNAGLWVDYDSIYTTQGITDGKYINADGTLGTSSTSSVVDYTPVQSGQTYNVDLGSISSDYSFRVVYYNSSKSVLSSTLETTKRYATMTTPSGTAYVRFQVPTANKNVVKVYTSPSIKVNNNGVYETIVNKNVYSTSEVVIGEFMGKPLYRRTAELTLSSTLNSWNSILNIPNIDIPTRISGGFKDGNYIYPLPYGEGTTYCVFAKNVNGSIYEKHTTSWFSGKSIYLIVEYTKSTDSGISTLSLD